MPDSFLTSRKRRLWEEAQQKKNVEVARRAQLELDYADYQNAEISRYIAEVMPKEEYRELFDQLRLENGRLFEQMTPAQLDEITGKMLAVEIKQKGRVPMLSFEDFRQKSPAAV